MVFFFYFGHRTCRYLLWVSHLTLFLTNFLLISETWFYKIIFAGQVLFYSIALLRKITKINNHYITLVYYYCITILAQWIGVFNILTGRAKPFGKKPRVQDKNVCF